MRKLVCVLFAVVAGAIIIATAALVGAKDSESVSGASITPAQIIVNEASADYDTRFEGDGEANLLYLDAGNDRVGIGTASPDNRLSVIGGAVRVGTGDTFNTTAGADDVAVEGTVEIHGQTAIGAGTTPSTFTAAGALSVYAGLTVNDSGADVDSRIEGDTEANLLYIDASTNRIGVGTASPEERLQIVGEGTRIGTGDTFNTTIGADDFGVEGTVEIHGQTAIGAGTTPSTFTAAGALSVYAGLTVNDASADVDVRIESDNLDDAFFIDGTNGRVGIGTSVPAQRLEVADTSSVAIDIISDENADDGDTNSILAFFIDGIRGVGTQVGQLIYDQGLDVMSLGYGTDNDVVINTNGFVGVNDTSPDAMLDIVTSAVSSSGTVITATASQTADLLSVRDSSEANMFRIGPAGGGQFIVRTQAQIDTRVPDFDNEIIVCSDCNTTGAICLSTGTAANMYARSDSLSTGCGSGD